MRRIPGQAAFGFARLLHRLATLAITVAILGGVAAAALAWRLSQGPVDLPWLATRLEAAANANGGPTKLAIGSVALTWEGFRLGVDRPLDLRLTNVTVTDQTGRRRMDIPQAAVSLSLHQLLFGRVQPRAVELNSPQLTLLRAPDGALSLDIGSLAEAGDSGAPSPGEMAKGEPASIAELLAELAQPAAVDRDRNRNALSSQLRLVRIRDARIVVVDRQLGATWRAPNANIDLTRNPRGGMDGSADVSLALGEQTARLTVTATLAAGATETHLRARLSPVTPAALARAVPALAALAAIDAPVSGEVELDLDAKLALRDLRLTAQSDAGTITLGRGSVAIRDAILLASGTPASMTLRLLRVALRGHDGGLQTVVQARGTGQRQSGQLNAAFSLGLDQAEFVDLERLWPEGVAGNARTWILANIPSGIARNGRFEMALAAQEDFSALKLTGATGTLDGDGLQVYWLRPVPPIDNGMAQLHLLDPDTLEIAVTSARQGLRGQKPDTATGGLQIRNGRVRITDLTQRDQVATIDADVTGSVPDAIALLRDPRLALLDRSPIELKNPTGQATVKLSVGVPLEHSLRIEDISIHAQGHLDDVHLGGVAAGRDLDQGVLDLDVTTESLKLTGRGLLAAIPARIDASMDFRPGPPGQVLQTLTVSGQPDAAQFATVGLDASAVLAGPVQLQATLTEHRNGQGEVAVTADLTGAELTASPLDWHKARNVRAKASARLTLERGRFTGIDALQLDGEGLALRGQVDVRDGKIETLRVDRLVLGRTIAHGTLRLPASPGAGPIVANLGGSTIDLAPRLSHRAQARKPSQRRGGAEPPSGPAWTIEARFDRALMAQDRSIDQLAFSAEHDGRVLQRLRVEGQTGSRSPFVMQIAPDKGGRRMTASAGDAGELLRGLDLVRTMQGGQLSIQAQYDDARPDRPLSGTANIADFRIRNAPALAKLLQAMTLYGLVEVMQGSGLGFSRLTAPFQLTDAALELTDARAFSPSLGLTMKGRIDLDAEQLDMQGTIVPAYFFNSLLGNIPLVGKLFSPERGGGVFAASYTLHGPLEDPVVSVNPLAALTPGFLRGLFGIF